MFWVGGVQLSVAVRVTGRATVIVKAGRLEVAVPSLTLIRILV